MKENGTTIPNRMTSQGSTAMGVPNIHAKGSEVSATRSKSNGVDEAEEFLPEMVN